VEAIFKPGHVSLPDAGSAGQFSTGYPDFRSIDFDSLPEPNSVFGFVVCHEKNMLLSVSRSLLVPCPGWSRVHPGRPFLLLEFIYIKGKLGSSKHRLYTVVILPFVAAIPSKVIIYVSAF